MGCPSQPLRVQEAPVAGSRCTLLYISLLTEIGFGTIKNCHDSSLNARWGAVVDRACRDRRIVHSYILIFLLIYTESIGPTRFAQLPGTAHEPW
jgi:hypothetical protein